MTITIDKATLARIRQIAGARGVSKFIAEAARDRAGRNELIELLEELDDKYGRPPPKMLAETDRDMRKIFGMPPPTKPWNPYAERDAATRRLEAKARKARKARKALKESQASNAGPRPRSRGRGKNRR